LVATKVRIVLLIPVVIEGRAASSAFIGLSHVPREPIEGLHPIHNLISATIPPSDELELEYYSEGDEPPPQLPEIGIEVPGPNFSPILMSPYSTTSLSNYHILEAALGMYWSFQTWS
jgi:hypothetical protein